MRLKLLAILLFSFVVVQAASARVIIDMTGRRVTIPNTIHRLYVPSPFGAYMMYALAPDLMTGTVFPPTEADKKFLPQQLLRLPTLGVLMPGMGMSSNPEMIIKSHPDVLVIWNLDRSPMDDRIAGALRNLNIPYVVVVGNNMYEYPAAIRFLGRLTGRNQRAEMLARTSEKILSNVYTMAHRVPANRRPRVYYAEGPDGLSTECNDSFHVEMLKVLGDLNVYRCHAKSHMGMDKISMEQVIMENPDAIVAQDPLFYKKVYQSPEWRQVKAVQQHRVYLVPRVPMNWFDRPPSFMRFIGVQWLANQLYPRAYPIDIVRQTRSFYKTFLGVSLTDQDARRILQQ